MRVCGLCAGIAQKPCFSYCIQTVKKCLRGFDEINSEWNSYVGAVEKITERLLGPFNIVMVVEPINIKISEAIMNFQVIYNHFK